MTGIERIVAGLEAAQVSIAASVPDDVTGTAPVGASHDEIDVRLAGVLHDSPRRGV